MAATPAQMLYTLLMDKDNRWLIAVLKGVRQGIAYALPDQTHDQFTDTA